MSLSHVRCLEVAGAFVMGLMVCTDCADILLRLRPGADLSDLVGRLQAGKGCPEDPQLGAEFAGARLVFAGEPQDFRPKGRVEQTSNYGIRLEQTFGILMDSEYGAMFGHTPKSLDKKPVQLPWKLPSALSNFHVIDLMGLGADTIASIRKVTLYADAGAAMSEVFLDEHSSFTRTSRATCLTTSSASP